jgi:hypothetical protein
MLIIVTLLFALLDQAGQAPVRLINPTNTTPNPGDLRLAQFDDEVKGTNWKVFSVTSFPDSPVVITQVEEVRQQNPPSSWAVYLGNRDYLPVATLTIAAAVVDVNGKVKTTQALPSMKNLKPFQVSRKETRIRTLVGPTDRVVFYVKEVKSESGDWKAVDAEVSELIKTAAQKLPVP